MKTLNFHHFWKKWIWQLITISHCKQTRNVLSNLKRWDMMLTKMYDYLSWSDDGGRGLNSELFVWKSSLFFFIKQKLKWLSNFKYILLIICFLNRFCDIFKKRNCKKLTLLSKSIEYRVLFAKFCASSDLQCTDIIFCKYMYLSW